MLSVVIGVRSLRWILSLSWEPMQSQREVICPRLCSQRVSKLSVIPELSSQGSSVPSTVPCSCRSHAALNHVCAHPQAVWLQYTQRSISFLTVHFCPKRSMDMQYSEVITNTGCEFSIFKLQGAEQIKQLWDPGR